MKYSGLFLFLLALAVVGCGSTTTETVVVTQTANESAPTGISTTAMPLPQAGAEVGNFSGIGSMTTQKFPLKSGAVRFTFKHEGSKNFAIFLLDSSGKVSGGVGNAIGAADSSKVLNIRADGEYMLDVQADGVWAVTIRPE